MSRTNSSNVANILLDNYDGTTVLDRFIDTAASLTNKVSTNDTASELDAADLELIERYLAAHFYCLADPLYASKSTGGASGSFQGQTGMGLDFTPYGQTAKRLDVTGYLARLDMPTRPKAGSIWLGKAPSNQIPYVNRD